MRAAWILALSSLAVACRDKQVEDLDGDGYFGDDDCDDDDAAVYPGAEEACDGVDNDCDGTADEGLAATWYTDADGDGYGDASTEELTCAPAANAVDNGEDCDDGDAAFYPGAPEDDCEDPNDYNCDGSTGYADADGDGAAACVDCDDADPARFEGNPEVCDGVDNDCDTVVDDDPVDEVTWYIDYDGDGFGVDGSFTTVACDQPAGYVDQAGDCDDTRTDANPDAAEVCDGIDNDCDGSVDVGASDAATFYADADADGYGDAATSLDACDLPSGYATDASDCDDADAAVNPAAAEVCNDETDNDCDGGFAGCAMSLADADVVLVGVGASDEAGIGIDRLGDMDGDGLDELAIGARSADEGGSDAGTTYFFWGSTVAGLSGQVDLGSADLLITGAAASAKSGKSIAGNGDYDGDGVLDLVVNAGNYSVSGTARGAFHVIYGGTLAAASGTLSLTDADVRYDGESSYDYTGGIVRNAGPVAGGSVDAILAGSVGDDDGAANAGAVYLLSGTAASGTTATLSSSNWTAKILGASASQAIGGAIAGAGDFDGDGFYDVLVGSSVESTGGSGAGAVYLLSGPLSGSISLSAADAVLLGAAGDYAGSVVSRVGDLDGDGTDDLGASGPYNDGVGTDSGVVWIVSGTTDVASLNGASLSAVATTTIGGAATDAYLGTAVNGDGDSDGDGQADLLVSAATASGGAGTTWLFRGPLSGAYTTDDADAALTGESANDGAGSPIRFVGDVTGTGADSILVSATGNDRVATDAGAAFLIHGIGE